MIPQTVDRSKSGQNGCIPFRLVCVSGLEISLLYYSSLFLTARRVKLKICAKKNMKVLRIQYTNSSCFGSVSVSLYEDTDTETMRFDSPSCSITLILNKFFSEQWVKHNSSSLSKHSPELWNKRDDKHSKGRRNSVLWGQRGWIWVDYHWIRWTRLSFPAGTVNVYTQTPVLTGHYANNTQI